MLKMPLGFKFGVKFKNFLGNITVEPFMFSFVFSFAITVVTQVTFMMDKICRTELEYGDEICGKLLKDPALLEYKQTVQKVLSEWLTIINYMQDIPSLLLSLIIGSWSDKHGRKKPMLLVLLMRILTFGGFLLNAIIPEIKTTGIIISWIPTCAFGGFIFMLCLSYISDITTEENRTRRIAVLSGVSFTGFPLGILIGSYIYEYGGFVAVYSTATAIICFGFIYALIRIKETRGDGKVDKEYFKDMFKLANFKYSLQTAFKKRDTNKRPRVIICLCGLGLVAVAFSTVGISYQYTQLMYTWGNKDYSLFSSATSFFNKLVITFFVPFLSNNLGFRETTIGIAGIMCMICSRVMSSLAKLPEVFWAAGVLDGLVFMSSVSSRSILSMSVDPSEIGKAFGVSSAFESIGGFIGGIAVQQLYKVTLDYFPSCCYIMTGFVGIVLLLAFLWMDVDIRRREVREVVSAADNSTNDEKEMEWKKLRMLSASVESGLNIDNLKTC